MRTRSHPLRWVAAFIWLLLFVATGWLWMNGRSQADIYGWSHSKGRQQLTSFQGRLILDWTSIHISTWVMSNRFEHHTIYLPPSPTAVHDYMASYGDGFKFESAGFAMTRESTTIAATTQAFSVPTWFPLVVFGLMTLRGFIRATSRPAALPGTCPECGYAISPNDSTCPKCRASIPVSPT